MVPWLWGVISSGRGIGVSCGELLAWDMAPGNGIISSDESVSLTSEVLWSGGHPGVGTHVDMLHISFAGHRLASYNVEASLRTEGYI